jgi:hypothetical protein
VCCITCQKLKVVEIEEVQEDSDHDADPYGSLNGGSPRIFQVMKLCGKIKKGTKR